MLPKINRLRHWKDFQAVYQQGIRCQGSILSLRVLRRSMESQSGGAEKPPTRLGISISRKVAKHATSRNRIKRQIRAALRQLLPEILPGGDCIVVVRPRARECNYSHFLQELKQLLAKAEVIHGHSRGNFL